MNQFQLNPTNHYSMKNRYEGLLILNVKGNEESANEIIERLEGEFKKEGAEIETGPEDRQPPLHLRRRARRHRLLRELHLPRRAGGRSRSLRSHFKLNADIYRQHYLKPPARRKPTAPGEGAKTRRRRLQLARPHLAASTAMPNLNKVMLIGNLHPRSRDQVHAEGHRHGGDRPGRQSQLHHRAAARSARRSPSSMSSSGAGRRRSPASI